MPVSQTPAQKLTDMRIQRALSKQGAHGMRGFLLWTEAAWPKAISRKIVAAASRYVPGSTLVPLASPAGGGFAGLGFLGDDTTMTITLPGLDQAASDAIAAANDPSQPPVSGPTAATPAQPATPSWLADIGNAITAATTAYLGAQQVKDAQSIFNVNLQRAQQGLPPIPTNPTQYGLPAPTAQIGLTSGTQSALLWGVGLLAGGLVLAGALGGHKRR